MAHQQTIEGTHSSLRNPQHCGVARSWRTAMRILPLATLFLTIPLFPALLPRNGCYNMAAHNPQPGKTKEPMPISDQVTSIPYFTLRDGLSSQLVLNNSESHPVSVTLTIFNPEGKAYSPSLIVVDAHSYKTVELKDVQREFIARLYAFSRRYDDSDAR